MNASPRIQKSELSWNLTMHSLKASKKIKKKTKMPQYRGEKSCNYGGRKKLRKIHSIWMSTCPNEKLQTGDLQSIMISFIFVRISIERTSMIVRYIPEHST